MTRHEVLPPWLRGFVKWRRWGWTQVTMGLFALLFVVPDLAGAPDTLTTILRVVALVVMVVGFWPARGADLPRARSDA